MGVQIHVLFKLIAIVFLNTLGVFGQPSVAELERSNFIKILTPYHFSTSCACFHLMSATNTTAIVFIARVKAKSVCCTSILGGNCTEDNLEVCEFNRQTNSYLPAFVTVTGSYTVDPYGEVNGTYVLLNLQYDGKKSIPIVSTNNWRGRVFRLLF